jgi:uncharacterized membrane protein YdjX (TVP38/TMEM64 family)
MFVGTVVAGYLFGFWVGSAVALLASTLGATGALLGTRYLVRDLVMGLLARRRGLRGWVELMNRGINRDGLFFLLLLRLSPAVPFVMINGAMGLTRVRAWGFFWVTLGGMLPCVLIYAYVGATAARIRGMADLFSVQVWVALVLLGSLPVVMAAVVWGLRRRRRHREPAAQARQ